jgi:hypothetical protein
MGRLTMEERRTLARETGATCFHPIGNHPIGKWKSHTPNGRYSKLFHPIGAWKSHKWILLEYCRKVRYFKVCEESHDRGKRFYIKGGP